MKNENACKLLYYQLLTLLQKNSLLMMIWIWTNDIKLVQSTEISSKKFLGNNDKRQSTRSPVTITQFSSRAEIKINKSQLLAKQKVLRYIFCIFSRVPETGIWKSESFKKHRNWRRCRPADTKTIIMDWCRTIFGKFEQQQIKRSRPFNLHN